jgi:hypothetical protein
MTASNDAPPLSIASSHLAQTNRPRTSNDIVVRCTSGGCIGWPVSARRFNGTITFLGAVLPPRFRRMAQKTKVRRH